MIFISLCNRLWRLLASPFFADPVLEATALPIFVDKVDKLDVVPVVVEEDVVGIGTFVVDPSTTTVPPGPIEMT
jgi:hypothetical protein